MRRTIQCIFMVIASTWLGWVVVTFTLTPITIMITIWLIHPKLTPLEFPKMVGLPLDLLLIIPVISLSLKTCLCARVCAQYIFTDMDLYFQGYGLCIVIWKGMPVGVWTLFLLWRMDPTTPQAFAHLQVYLGVLSVLENVSVQSLRTRRMESDLN